MKGPIEQFFDRYAEALLAGDVKKVAGMYSVPSLVVVPGKISGAKSPEDVEEFVRGFISRFEPLKEYLPKFEAVASDADYVHWVDVTWSYDEDGTGIRAQEHIRYLLTGENEKIKITAATLLNQYPPLATDLNRLLSGEGL